MITAIKNLYLSSDLYGNCFTQPLKSYQAFFAKKIDDSSFLNPMAIKLAQVAIGIILYPILGALTVLGLAVKMIGLPSLYAHNRAEHSSLQTIENGVKHAVAYENHSAYSRFEKGWAMQPVKEFIVTKQNVEPLCQAIRNEIDVFSHKFRKVYVASAGAINQGRGSIVVKLRLREPVG